ncbi:TetR/AcrR family transcriptional regulator [Streptosporangium sp. NPDC051023]|uniref:TetR/AcrR family transcriptional regulator n=1 Tax=Streptosporangium sp. NPDC051023 TaxID=3155410 RepID=UPI003450BF86
MTERRTLARGAGTQAGRERRGSGTGQSTAAGRGDGRRAETRLRLFAAAVEVIAEQGYTAATVDAIAERAGVAKGTVFYNFGSKEGLFTALLEHGIQRLADAMSEADTGRAGAGGDASPPSGLPGEAGTGEGSGEAQAEAEAEAEADEGEVGAKAGEDGVGTALGALDAVVMAQLRFFEEYGAFARVLLTEMWRTAWQDTIARLREKALGVYAVVLRRAVAEGTIRADLDVDTAATAVFGMVLTVSIERRALHPDRPIEQLHATLVDLLHGRVSGKPLTG